MRIYRQEEGLTLIGLRRRNKCVDQRANLIKSSCVGAEKETEFADNSYFDNR